MAIATQEAAQGSPRPWERWVRGARTRDQDKGPGHACCLILAASDGASQKVPQLLVHLHAHHHPPAPGKGETAPPVVDSAAKKNVIEKLSLK